jgi:hypothetical protein
MKPFDNRPNNFCVSSAMGGEPGGSAFAGTATSAPHNMQDPTAARPTLVANLDIRIPNQLLPETAIPSQ